MEKFVLTATLRDITQKTSDIRNNKLVPAVVYGHNVAPTHISVDASEFLKLSRKAGTTHLVELSVEGKKYPVLIHEFQKHPVGGQYLHVDFFAVNISEKISVQIPLRLVGKSQAVVEGAELIQNLHMVEVKSLASDLVDAIEVEIDTLVRVGDVIHVSDIVAKYPKIEFITPSIEAIVSAFALKEYSDELQTTDIADVATVQDEKAASKEAE